MKSGTAALVAKAGFTTAGVAALAAAAVLGAHGAPGKTGHYAAATDLLSPSPYPTAARATASTTRADATVGITPSPLPVASPGVPTPVVAGLAVVAPAHLAVPSKTSPPGVAVTPNPARPTPVPAARAVITTPTPTPTPSSARPPAPTCDPRYCGDTSHRHGGGHHGGGHHGG